MVAVPKKSGGVRICVDLKPLNESVMRQTHPLPTVESVPAQLSGSKVFSKLGANSGFWPLFAPNSREIRTGKRPRTVVKFSWHVPFELSF